MTERQKALEAAKFCEAHWESETSCDGCPLLTAEWSSVEECLVIFRCALLDKPAPPTGSKEEK